MTSSIRISHEGPPQHAVHVEVVTMQGGGPTTQRTIVLKAGETTDAIALHDGASVHVSEQPVEKVEPAAEPPLYTGAGDDR